MAGVQAGSVWFYQTQGGWLRPGWMAFIVSAERRDWRTGSVVHHDCGDHLLSCWLDRVQTQRDLASAAKEEQLIVESMLDIPTEQPTPDEGTAGLNKGNGGGSKPKQEKAGGGGGGGREDPKPASFGKTPQASLTVPQVVAPDPKPPGLRILRCRWRRPSLRIQCWFHPMRVFFHTASRIEEHRSIIGPR